MKILKTNFWTNEIIGTDTHLNMVVQIINNVMLIFWICMYLPGKEKVHRFLEKIQSDQHD